MKEMIYDETTNRSLDKQEGKMPEDYEVGLPKSGIGLLVDALTRDLPDVRSRVLLVIVGLLVTFSQIIPIVIPIGVYYFYGFEPGVIAGLSVIILEIPRDWRKA